MHVKLTLEVPIADIVYQLAAELTEEQLIDTVVRLAQLTEKDESIQQIVGALTADLDKAANDNRNRV